MFRKKLSPGRRSKLLGSMTGYIYYERWKRLLCLEIIMTARNNSSTYIVFNSLLGHEIFWKDEKDYYSCKGMMNDVLLHVIELLSLSGFFCERWKRLLSLDRPDEVVLCLHTVTARGHVYRIIKDADSVQQSKRLLCLIYRYDGNLGSTRSELCNPLSGEESNIPDGSLAIV